MDGPALRAQGQVKEFRGFRAVDGVDLEIAEGSVHALVGPNGAGKTTLFNLLTGFLQPTAGRILLGRRDLTGKPPEQVARHGVARSFQITSLFPRLTPVEHNMNVVSTLADRVTVLQSGRVLVEGPYGEIRHDPRVVSAYLGDAHAAH